MMQPAPRNTSRCAIYTRKSTEHNLELEFNSLDAQREACEAYIKSQAHEGWRLIRARYEMGAYRAPPWIALPFRNCWMM
jgi:site-specific DNA recombinase